MAGEVGVNHHHSLALSWGSVKHVVHHTQSIPLQWLPVISGLTVPCFIGFPPSVSQDHILNELPTPEIFSLEEPELGDQGPVQ